MFSVRATRHRKPDKDSKQETEELYKTIGQLKVEVDWLKKNFSSKKPVRTALHD